MVSIIIPAHNEEQNLQKLVPHILNRSTNQDFEIIIVLSATNNDSSHQLKFNEKVTVINSPSKGRAVQMNYGAKVARGSVLAFLHADVIPPDDFVTDMNKAISNGFLAGFFSYRFDSPSRLLAINASFTSNDGIFTGGGDQCLFMQHTTFEKLGGFDDSQVIMEDFEIFRRMKRNQVPYKIIKNDLLVSARKYDRNSYLKVNLSNLVLLILFKLHFPSQKIKTLHNLLIRPVS